MSQHDPDLDVAWLQNQLAESHKTIRGLLRQLSKEQARHSETTRAYHLTIANLQEATRENNQLARDRDHWRTQAERGPRNINLSNIPLHISNEEASAIRKAIARLHHPDVGGDAERMKAWNAILDPLDRA